MPKRRIKSLAGERDVLSNKIAQLKEVSKNINSLIKETPVKFRTQAFTEILIPIGEEIIETLERTLEKFRDDFIKIFFLHELILKANAALKEADLLFTAEENLEKHLSSGSQTAYN